MPEPLETIVQRMIDAGESEENIATVIQGYKKPTQKEVNRNLKEAVSKYPKTEVDGFMESLKSGEAVKAGLQGAGGFLRGAVLDLPASLYEGVKTAGNLLTSPVETGKEIITGLSNLPDEFIETASRAGSDPHAFGRMMGQFTGQPLATAGIPSIPVKAGVRTAGRPVEATGRIMRKHQPLSGFVPRIAEMRTMRSIERGVGSGVERLGQRMKKVGIESELPPFDVDVENLGPVVPPTKTRINPRLLASPDVAGETVIRPDLKGPPPTEIMLDDLVNELNKPKLDPRVTSLAPEGEAPIVDVFDESGRKLGGRASGETKPIVEREAITEIDPAEARARIEAAREAARREVDLETAVPDEFVESLPEVPEAQVLDPSLTDVNASLESAASAEAISRQVGMKSRGEQFVVYDRAGNKKPGHVDYVPREGETFGIESPAGFRVLEDKGGKITKPDVRVVDEQGNPIETKEWTPNELAERQRTINSNWGSARSKARELGIDDKKYRSLTDLESAIEKRKVELEGEGRVPPARRLKIHRGPDKDPIDIVFQSPDDKELFSAIGRSRQQLSGKSGISPDWEGLAKRFGVSQSEIYNMAKEFREKVINLTKNHKKGVLVIPKKSTEFVRG